MFTRSYVLPLPIYLHRRTCTFHYYIFPLAFFFCGVSPFFQGCFFDILHFYIFFFMNDLRLSLCYLFLDILLLSLPNLFFIFDSIFVIFNLTLITLIFDFSFDNSDLLLVLVNYLFFRILYLFILFVWIIRFLGDIGVIVFFRCSSSIIRKNMESSLSSFFSRVLSMNHLEFTSRRGIQKFSRE